MAAVHAPPRLDRGPAARIKAVTLPTMLAVADFSTWPTPQTPASQGRPRCRARPHTPRASPHAAPPSPRQGRVHPPRVAGRHVCARRGVSPTQPVHGDEHEPCPRTCSRRMRTAPRSAPSMPDIAVSLPGGQGYREKVAVPGWVTTLPSPARWSPGQPDRTPRAWRNRRRGNGSGSHLAVPDGCRCPCSLSCASDVSAHAARRLLAARLSLARRGFFRPVRG